MDIDDFVTTYMVWLKQLPAKEFYSFCHGAFMVQERMLDRYLKTLKLGYLDYSKLMSILSDGELARYIKTYMEVPLKKVVKKKRVVDDSDSE